MLTKFVRKKLQSRYTGPFKLVQQLGNAWKIVDETGNKRIVSSEHLKLYNKLKPYIPWANKDESEDHHENFDEYIIITRHQQPVNHGPPIVVHDNELNNFEQHEPVQLVVQHNDVNEPVQLAVQHDDVNEPGQLVVQHDDDNEPNDHVGLLLPDNEVPAYAREAVPQLLRPDERQLFENSQQNAHVTTRASRRNINHHEH